MCLKPPKTLGQVLAPWGLAWCLCARRQGCGCAAGSRLTQGPLKSPKGISVFLNGKQVLPCPFGPRARRPLHHGIEGTSAVAAAPRQRLCGQGTATLGRVRGHEEDTAAVG